MIHYRILVLVVLLFCSSIGLSQMRYVSKTGHVSFYSEAPLEKIEALNEQASAVVDLDRYAVAVSMLMKDFHFEKSMMEEHFNENYVESEKYPRATFAGTFKSNSPIDVNKNAVHAVNVEGKLTLHGITKNIKTTGSVEVKENALILKTRFRIAIRDYNIEVQPYY